MAAGISEYLEEQKKLGKCLGLMSTAFDQGANEIDSKATKKSQKRFLRAFDENAKTMSECIGNSAKNATKQFVAKKF